MDKYEQYWFWVRALVFASGLGIPTLVLWWILRPREGKRFAPGRPLESSLRASGGRTRWELLHGEDSNHTITRP